MGRRPCCEKGHIRRGPWSKEEDDRLVRHINANGLGCWRSLPRAAGLKRCGKSCRLRWINYLRPDVKRGNFTEQEDEVIVNLHASHGNKWSLIASRLPGRTDNEIKNYWNGYLKRRLYSNGIDPKTHQPIKVFPALPAATTAPPTITAPPSAVPMVTTNNNKTNKDSSVDFTTPAPATNAVAALPVVNTTTIAPPTNTEAAKIVVTTNNTKTDEDISNSNTDNSSEIQLFVTCVNTKINGAGSPVGENSNSTEEETYPENKLELSLGLPSQEQKGLCFFCSLGFPANNKACSCKAKAKVAATTTPALDKNGLY